HLREAQSLGEVLVVLARGFKLVDVSLLRLKLALVLRSAALGLGSFFLGWLLARLAVDPDRLFLGRLLAALGVGPGLDGRNFRTLCELAADGRTGLVVRVDLLADLPVGRLGIFLQQPRDQLALQLAREMPAVKVERVGVLLGIPADDVPLFN